MSSLITALDSSVEEAKMMKLGENGHSEYTWSTDIQEKIVQLSFQLVRSDATKMSTLSIQLDSLLETLSAKEGSPCYKSVLFRMLAHTRDIVSGKGEYALSYMMLFSWYKYFPDLALFAVETFVMPEEEGGQPYGSWKDMKYLAH